MITLSTVTYDLNGSLELTEIAGSALANLQRRVSRIATLDGGSIMPDYGYSDTDRTLILVVNIDTEKLRALNRLITLYPRLVLSCREGLFSGAIQRTKQKSKGLTITFLVAETLS